MVQEFMTTDPNTAAFLLTKGHRLIRMEAGPWKRLVFEATAQQDAEAFNDDGPIPARSFVRRLRDVRGLLWQPPATRAHAQS